MAPHSSTLAWKIPWMEEPGRLPMPGHLSELHPVNEVNTKGQFFVHRSEKTPGSKYSSTSGLSPRGHLERQAEFHASTQDEA